MRTVTYGAACSLDGFITARDGALDWLHFSGDVQGAMAAYWRTVDTILMGRKTWEAAAAQGGGQGGGQGGAEGEGKSGKRSKRPKASPITTYLFSRTLRAAPPDAHLIASDAAEFVRGLKAEPGRGICVMGGGELAQSLFAAGVIDEVGLNVHPVLLGAGVPLFRDPGLRVALELAESRVIDGGCVLSTYRVRRDA